MSGLTKTPKALPHLDLLMEVLQRSYVKIVRRRRSGRGSEGMGEADGRKRDEEEDRKEGKIIKKVI